MQLVGCYVEGVCLCLGSDTPREASYPPGLALLSA